MSTSDRITRTIDMSAGTVTFECNGTKVVVVAGALAPDVQRRAMLHGLNATVGDAAALETKEIDGKMHRPTCKEKLDAIRDRITVLESGKWSDSADRPSKTPDLIAAIMAITGGSEEDTRDAYEALTKEERAILRREPTVAAKLAAIRAERQPGGTPQRTSILAKFGK